MDNNLGLDINDWISLSPMLILLSASLIFLLIECFAEKTIKKFSISLACIALIFALYAAFYLPESHNLLLTAWIRFDSLARFLTILFLLIGLASTLLASSLLQKQDSSPGEYLFLLFSSLIGLILIGVAADFLTLFLGLEILSISLYILCGYMKKWEVSHEAAAKYFLIGSIGTAFLLYGIALIYGAVGTTRFVALLNAYHKLNATQEIILFLSGIALITVGLSFKAAIVPFHTWAPDVYAGASTPITAFMAVGTKTGAIAAFALLFLVVLPQFHPLWNQGVALLAIFTLVYANVIAIQQKQLRRFFAYSGISHAGYLLIGLAAGTPEALSAILFYLVVYALATLGSFAVLTCFDLRLEGVLMNDLKGLFYRSPLLSSLLIICLLTLAGIPPTIGFFAKFYIFKVAFQAGYYALVVVGLLATILSGYYYLIIIALLFTEKQINAANEKISFLTHSWPVVFVGTVCFAAILLFSCYPGLLFHLKP